MYESYRIQKSQKRFMMQSVIPILRDSIPLWPRCHCRDFCASFWRPSVPD